MKANQRYYRLIILVFLVALAHQILQKVFNVQIFLLHAYLDDFLCMPILLAIWQWERQLWWKKTSLHKFDLLYFTVFIFIFFEYIIPKFNTSFTADWYDGLAYGCGSLFYWTIQPVPQ